MQSYENLLISKLVNALLRKCPYHIQWGLLPAECHNIAALDPEDGTPPLTSTAAPINIGTQLVSLAPQGPFKRVCVFKVRGANHGVPLLCLFPPPLYLDQGQYPVLLLSSL